MWSLTGKVIVVTGAAGGIGAAGAAELARRGARVVMTDRDGQAVEATAAAVPGAVAAVLDVTDADACGRLVHQVAAEHGAVDAVWANAGVATVGPVEYVESDVWARVIQVNLVGAYNIIRAALPAVIKSQGYVAMTASLASFAHPPAMSAYAASKAGLEAFADSLRIEVAHQGVAVGVFHPSWIDTDLVRNADRNSSAFQVLRAGLRAPFARTYPVESVAVPIAEAFQRRQARLFVPGFARLAHLGRPVLHTRLAERDYRRAAPQIRRAFEEQMSQQGARRAALDPDQPAE